MKDQDSGRGIDFIRLSVNQRTVKIDAAKKTKVIATKNPLIESSETPKGLSGCMILPALIINIQTDNDNPIPSKEITSVLSEAVDKK